MGFNDRIVVSDVEVTIKNGGKTITRMFPGTISVLGILLHSRESFDPDRLTVNGFLLGNRAFCKPISQLPVGNRVLIEVF